MNTYGKASINRIKQKQRACGRVQVTTMVWNDICMEDGGADSLGANEAQGLVSHHPLG